MSSEAHLTQPYLSKLQERYKQRSKPVLEDRPRGFNPKILTNNSADGKYFCSDCHWILRQPLQSFCGHRYCTDCFSYLIQSSSEPLKCQLCIQEGTESEFTILKREQTFPDNGIRREVDALDAACINRGCDWTGRFKDYQTHEKECAHKQVQCPECGCYLKPHELSDHRERCPASPATCPYCKEEMTKGQIKYHNCPKLPLTCPGCQKKLLRDELLLHSEPGASSCAKPHVQCVFGCEDIIQPVDLNDHLNRNLESHICDINERIVELEAQLKDVLGGRPIPAGGASGATAGTTTSTTAGTVPAQQYAALEKRVEKAESGLARLIQRMESSNRGGNVVLPGMSAEGTALSMEPQKQIEILDKKMVVFERVCAIFKQEIEKIGRQTDDLLKNNQETKDRLEAVLRQFRDIEKQFGSQKTTVTDISQRLLSSEASSYDGTLIWKLNNFQQRRQDAVAGRVTSFYSPCFYTSRTGYKACARIYLDGDGMGKKSHISLFFVLMRGEFDALLPWPFQQKVTLMWMDQNKRENIIDTFRPDPTSTSFKRPTSDMNIASGCPLFMPLATLESPTQGYVKDDVGFIKISIDKTNL